MKSINLPDYTIPANKVPLVEPKRVEKSDLDILKRRIVDNLKDQWYFDRSLLCRRRYSRFG